MSEDENRCGMVDKVPARMDAEEKSPGKGYAYQGFDPAEGGPPLAPHLNL